MTEQSANNWKETICSSINPFATKLEEKEIKRLIKTNWNEVKKSFRFGIDLLVNANPSIR